MGEFRWIKMSLFLLLVLQFTATTQQLFLSSIVRAGDDATLSCENVIDGQNNCNSTTWIFTDARRTAAVELITLGQIGNGAKNKSDRLSVTENCSLVIKKVTVEDVGRYDCQQYNKSGNKQGQDGRVLLSVVTMTEKKDDDDDDDDNEVTLNCSVSTYERCRLKVKWLYNSDELKDNSNMKTSQSGCSVSVTIETPHFIYDSRKQFLKCEVTDGNKKFTFSLQSSGKKPGEETTRETSKQATAATTEPTTTEPTTTTLTRTTDDASTKLKDLWWVFIIVAAVVLVALLIIVVKVIRWKRDKGNKTQMNDKIGLTSDPEVTQSAPETGQDTADPEDGVSYASVSYTKKTNSDAWACSKNDDEGDAVTYSTVKVSSTDPSSLYATVHKPQ